MSKNILITPHVLDSSNPVINFYGNTTGTIRLEVLTNGQLSFMGSRGVGFSIIDASNTIIAEIDVSGLLQVNGSINANSVVLKYAPVNASDAVPKSYDDQRWVDINRTGFVNENDVSMVFNPSTYVLQLIRTGATWRYMRDGLKYSFATDPSILVGNPPAKGMNYITINNNNGTLEVSTIGWTLLDSTLPVATLLWDSSLSPVYHLADERHMSLMDRRTHAYLHFTQGTRYVSGGTISGPTVGGTTNLTNVFSITPTTIADEDMFETLPALALPDGSTHAYTCFFRTNASTWVWEDSSVPYRYGNTNLIQWDNNGTMTNAANSNGNWYNWYLLFTNVYGRARYTMIPGRAIFGSLALAQAEDPKNFDFTGYPIAEGLIAYQFSWETRSTQTNQGKVRLGAIPKKINIATVTSVGTAASVNHNSLLGLQGGQAGEYYHMTANEFDVNRRDSSTKASNAAGIQGQIMFDASYLYVCTSTNTWGRLLLQTGY